MTQTPEQIAASLTKAQREALVGDPNADMPTNVALSFIAMKLVRPVLKDPFAEHFGLDDICMDWSETGQQVRAILEKNNG